MRQHHIAAEEVFTDLPNASELNVSWEFLLGLRARGRDAAEAWLAKGTAESTALPETKSWLAVLDAAVKAQRKPLFAYIGERWHKLVAEYRSKFRSKDAPKKAPKLFRQPAPPVRPFSA